MLKRERNIVSAVLVSKDNKILLGKIRDGGVYPDCWHIPGGGIEERETKEEALIREIQEETGLDIKDSPKKLLSDTDSAQAVKTDKVTGKKFLVTMHFNDYEINLPTTAKDTTIILSDDLKDFIWISKKELKDYKLTPPSEKLFLKLGWIKTN